MVKEISKVIKVQVRGGAANPSPPLGPALGAAGVNIMEFCKQFNGRTQEKQGKLLPVNITVYVDKSFDFVIKTPPAAVQCKYIICGSGNVSIWITFFRGSSDNVIQFLNIFNLIYISH